jgi:hypothetical protein
LDAQAAVSILAVNNPVIMASVYLGCAFSMVFVSLLRPPYIGPRVNALVRTNTAAAATGAINQFHRVHCVLVPRVDDCRPRHLLLDVPVRSVHHDRE